MSPTTPPDARERPGRRRLLLRAWAAGVAAPLVAIVLAGGSTPPRGALVLETGPVPSAGTRPSPVRAASLTEPAPARAVVAPAFVEGHGAGAVPAYAVASAVARRALPDDVLGAYWLAVQVAPAGCHLPVTLLMAVGQVESGNLVGRRLDDSHRPVPAILGPVLDGSRGRAVADTDAGLLDGDTRWDRAVGPLQFVPASWRAAGVDLDGDGRRDPQDVYDAAGAAMVYFCAGDRDLSTADGLRGAVLAYNHSRGYLDVVLRWKSAFDAAAMPMTTPLRAALTGGGDVPGPAVLAAPPPPPPPSVVLLGPAATRTTRTARLRVTPRAASSSTATATADPPVGTPRPADLPVAAPTTAPPPAPTPATPPAATPPAPIPPTPPTPSPTPTPALVPDPVPPPPPAPVPPPAPEPPPPPPPLPPPVEPPTCPADLPPMVLDASGTPVTDPAASEVQPGVPGEVLVSPECQPPSSP